MSEFAIFAGLFLFVMTGVVLAGYAFGGIEAREGSGESLLGAPDLDGTKAFLAQAFQKVGEKVPAPKKDSGSLRTLLIAAGYRYPSAVSVFYGIRSAAAALLAAIVVITATFKADSFFSGLIGVACAAGFGFLLPEMILKRMIQSRRQRIRRGIPVALDLLVLSLQAGQALNQAVVDTSTELRLAHPDLSAELWQVNLELRAGKSRADALHNLGSRNGEPELRKLANLMVDSDRFGSTLAPALKTHAKYMRTRMRQQAQESARKVTVKLIFPVFLLIFPSVLLVTLGPAVLHMMKSFADFTR
jgi:tight adherence protein C